MTKTQNIIASGGLALACGVLYMSAVMKPDKTQASPQPVPTQLAQNSWKSTEAADQSFLNAASPTPTPAVALPPPIAEKVDTVGTETGGKDVVPPDGKEVLPADGKEALPPVGIFIPTRPSSVDPANGGPPAQFVNPAPTTNQLLAPPNPENVAGPVVSPETR